MCPLSGSRRGSSPLVLSLRSPLTGCTSPFNIPFTDGNPLKKSHPYLPSGKTPGKVCRLYLGFTVVRSIKSKEIPF